MRDKKLFKIMGKKKKKESRSGGGGGGGGSVSDDAYDSDASAGSDETLIGAALMREQGVDVDGLGEEVAEKINELIELLGEKRFSTRENALSDLIKILCLGCRTEVCENVQETLGMYLCTSIRRGKAKESALGSRALSIVAVTIGMDHDGFVESALPVLEIMSKKGKNDTSRSEAIMAMTILCFICSTNEEASSSSIRVLSSIVSQASKDLVAGKKSKKVTPPKVVAAACRGWSLLASVARKEMFEGQMFDDCVGQFHILLGHSMLDVKIAAGECIALLFDTMGMKLSNGTAVTVQASEAEHDDVEGGFLGAAVANAKKEAAEGEVKNEGEEAEDDEEEEDGDDDDDDDDDDDGSSHVTKAQSYRGRSSSKSGRGTDYDEDETLEETLSRLAHEYNRKKNRKERKEQRAVFRDMYSTVVEGDVLETSLTIEGEEISFDTWSERIQLSALRSQLSSGFQIHVRDNEVIRQIFNLGRHTGKQSKMGMSKLEKRMYKSKNSFANKERTQQRNSERSKRRNVKNDFMLSQ